MEDKDNNPIIKSDKEQKNEEVYEIDPNDLIIIYDPKNWKPSEEIILAYAKLLGYKQTDPEELLKIAEKYLTCDLSDNLVRAFVKDDLSILYIDTKTNDIFLEINLETKAKEEFEECRNKYKSKNQAKNDFDEKDQINQKPKRINKLGKLLNDQLEKNKKLLEENKQLKEILSQKNLELNGLKAKIETLKSENEKLKNDSTKTNDINDIIVVNFVSTDYNIQEEIKCLKSDVFAEVEEKLYKKYEHLRNTNNLFTVNALPILRFKKLRENGIKDGDKIQLFKMK